MTPPETRKLPITREQATIMLQAIKKAKSGTNQIDISSKICLVQSVVSNTLSINSGYWSTSISSGFISNALENNLRKICGVLGLDFDTVYRDAVSPNTTTQAPQRADVDIGAPPEVRQVADQVTAMITELAEIRANALFHSLASPEDSRKAAAAIALKLLADLHNSGSLEVLCRDLLGISIELAREQKLREK